MVIRTKRIFKRAIKRQTTKSKLESKRKELKNEKPILGFRVRKKVDNIPNEVFSLVILTIIANCKVSRIFINAGSSCDIMYYNLFERLGLEI